MARTTIMMDSARRITVKKESFRKTTIRTTEIYWNINIKILNTVHCNVIQTEQLRALKKRNNLLRQHLVGD
jgi:hypothetical protein